MYRRKLSENDIENLKMMDNLFKIVKTTNNYVERWDAAWKMVDIMDSSNMIKKYWAYYEGEHLWKNRFKCIRNYHIDTQDGISRNTFNDGINYYAPEESGLYFIGDSHINPHTGEEYYWVKIGKSNNLARRMRDYNTCCPMLWRIDFAVHDEALEGYYHNLLNAVAVAVCNHNEEWFMVSKKTYLEMCAKGFKYFD